MTAGPASGPSLLDDALSLTRQPGISCGVERLFIYHPELAGQFREAIAAGVQSSSLAEAIKRRGIDLPQSTIGRHRRGDCSCRS